MGIHKTLCEKIKVMAKSGITSKEIAEKYNLKEELIQVIVSR